ncbi:MAG: AsmA family protein [Gammaproteobacteria bacterium]|nr:AsmA family protein [Gammaproteobacteria bacterium]
MKILLKILAVLIAIPVLLFLVAAVILATIDLNDYRDNISAATTKATGRQLTVTGELSKSFFPWLGVKVGAISLGNAKGFKESSFVSVEKIEIKVDTLSLLRLKPVIDKIILNGLNVSLTRNSEGLGNWEDLTAQKTTITEKPTTTTASGSKDDTASIDVSATQALQTLSVAGIEIQNARLTWDDQQSKSRYELKNLNVTLSEIAVNKPIKLHVAFDVSSSAPKLQSHIEINSERIEWDIEKQQYQLLPLTLSVEVQGDPIPGESISAQLSTEITADIAQQQLFVKQFTLQTLGLDLKGQLQANQFLETPQYAADFTLATFNLRELLKKLEITLPPMNDDKAMSSLALDFEFKGDTNNLELQTLNIKLDDTTITAQSTISQFNQPAIQFTLKVDNINVDRYLPPIAEPATATTAPEPSTVSETPPEPLPIPSEFLRTLNVDGELTVQQLTVSKLQSDNINIRLKAKHGIVDINPLNLNLSGGSIKGNAQLNVASDTPTITLQQQIDGVNAAPLLKAFAGDDYVSGILNLKTNVTTAGLFINDLKQNLNGTTQFRFTDGAVKGLNLAQIFREIKAKLKGEKYTPSDTPKQTDFTELSGSATITNGIVINNDLASKSPLLRVKGEGRVELPGDKMDYLVTAYIVGTSKGQEGKELNELKGLAIPVRIKGPFDKLDIAIDYDPIWKSYKNKYKQQLKSSLKESKQAKKQALQQQKDKKITEEKQRIKEKTDELKEKLRDKFNF